MGAQQPSEEQRTGEFSPPAVSLRGLIRWRFGVAGATLVAMLVLTVLGLREAAKGCFGPLVLMAALLADAILLPLFVLPSWIIARSLTRHPRPAVWLALIHDLLILILAILMVVFISLDTKALELLTALNSPPLWLGLALALTFGAEAAYLLRVRWQWRPTWPVFALLAAGLIATAALIPAFVTARKARDVRPLLTYVNAHWVKIPPGTRLALGQRSTGPGKHTDFVSIRGRNASWDLSAEHGRDGRWTFPTPQKRPTFVGNSVLPTAGRVFSFSQAKALLLRCGVVDTGLSSGRVIKERYRSDEYELRSPLAKGHYRVSDSGHIGFYLERPVELP